jgi:hypothetical protein
MQWCGKQVIVATYKHATVEEFLEDVAAATSQLLEGQTEDFMWGVFKSVKLLQLFVVTTYKKFSKSNNQSKPLLLSLICDSRFQLA